MSLFERVAAAFREPGAGAVDGDGDENGDGRKPTEGDRAVTDGEGSGADGGGRDAEADDGRGPDPGELTDAVVAVCQRAPEGIRTYTIEVAAEGAEITEVAPGLLEAHFEVVEGGVGTDGVTVRAVDFRGEARSVEAETLVGVRFAEPVPLADVRMRLVSAEDHDGETLPPDRFRLAAVE
ncbi:hypothetical protein [Halobaculum sp. EA56]|uniref:hypothetical protein n=1 Tax=Halobaculum sp. EA56 TaxID=3421648 RepID=UPI003EBBB348